MEYLVPAPLRPTSSVVAGKAFRDCNADIFWFIIVVFMFVAAALNSLVQCCASVPAGIAFAARYAFLPWAAADGKLVPGGAPGIGAPVMVAGLDDETPSRFSGGLTCQPISVTQIGNFDPFQPFTNAMKRLKLPSR